MVRVFVIGCGMTKASRILANWVQWHEIWKLHCNIHTFIISWFWDDELLWIIWLCTYDVSYKNHRYILFGPFLIFIFLWTLPYIFQALSFSVPSKHLYTSTQKSSIINCTYLRKCLTFSKYVCSMRSQTNLDCFIALLIYSLKSRARGKISIILIWPRKLPTKR